MHLFFVVIVAVVLQTLQRRRRSPARPHRRPPPTVVAPRCGSVERLQLCLQRRSRALVFDQPAAGACTATGCLVRRRVRGVQFRQPGVGGGAGGLQSALLCLHRSLRRPLAPLVVRRQGRLHRLHRLLHGCQVAKRVHHAQTCAVSIKRS